MRVLVSLSLPLSLSHSLSLSLSLSPSLSLWTGQDAYTCALWKGDYKLYCCVTLLQMLAPMGVSLCELSVDDMQVDLVVMYFFGEFRFNLYFVV